jgi:hypothetical protein
MWKLFEPRSTAATVLSRRDPVVGLKGKPVSVQARESGRLCLLRAIADTDDGLDALSCGSQLLARPQSVSVDGAAIHVVGVASGIGEHMRVALGGGQWDLCFTEESRCGRRRAST